MKKRVLKKGNADIAPKGEGLTPDNRWIYRPTCMGVHKKRNTERLGRIQVRGLSLLLEISCSASRPQLEEPQVVLIEAIDFTRDDMVAEKFQRRLFPFVPIGTPF